MKSDNFQKFLYFIIDLIIDLINDDTSAYNFKFLHRDIIFKYLKNLNLDVTKSASKKKIITDYYKLSLTITQQKKEIISAKYTIIVIILKSKLWIITLN